MSSTRSSLPTAISAKSPSAMAREPGTPGDKAAAAGQAVSLGNLQIFLRERVADLTRALEVKASTDFHDWLVSPPTCRLPQGRSWRSSHLHSLMVRHRMLILGSLALLFITYATQLSWQRTCSILFSWRMPTSRCV